MRLLLAILVGRLIANLSRYLKIGGGTAAPGLYALKIYPELVEELIHHIPRNVIITGTNGKTTTARMLAHFARLVSDESERAKDAGLKVIRNHTGSNLERGIASALISHYTLYPKPDTLDLGIWELDEAAFNSVASRLKPNIVVFLNVFRDQLDRYCEVDTVVKNWCETLKKMPKKTIVLVNADDANTAKLEKCFKGRVITFGVKDYKLVGESLEKKKNSKKLDFEAENVKLDGLKGSSFQLTINHELLNINLPLPGIYHIYDALAAIATASHLFTDIQIHRLTDILEHFKPAFGRVEKIAFPHVKWGAYIFLIKNPAGATQVFETIAPELKINDRLLLALNDNLADGTDVSWIWDANFESLRNSSRAKPHSLRAASQGRAKSRKYIYISGTRAYDLAVRLKYAGFDSKQIHIEPSLKNALKQARKGLKGTLFILPTYTAMLEIQKILVKMGVKKEYWNE